ncbi:Hypothetical predicted protein, partial [Pelobates cultripes]
LTHKNAEYRHSPAYDRLRGLTNSRRLQGDIPEPIPASLGHTNTQPTHNATNQMMAHPHRYK